MNHFPKPQQNYLQKDPLGCSPHSQWGQKLILGGVENPTVFIHKAQIYIQYINKQTALRWY